MASTTLYPPVVDTSAAAFVASGDSAYCRLYFSLSRFSSSVSDIESVHVSVIKQNSGLNVINKVDNISNNSIIANRYRSSGILIINSAPIPVENEKNLYYIDILNEDVVHGDAVGWQAGWIYKIQIRLSSVKYTGSIGQSAWLNAEASNFSEWSTYCTTKAIAQPRVQIPILNNFDTNTESTSANSDKTYGLSLSTFEFSGNYSNEDESEVLYSYSIKFYDNLNNLVEDSGVLYTNQYYTPNQFYYLFKHEFTNGEKGTLVLEYATINKYIEKYSFNINIAQTQISNPNVSVITLDNLSSIEDNDFVKAFTSQTNLVEEQEDGRIGIKLYSLNTNSYNGNICLRRADSRDNYSTWTDIKIIVCVDTIINNLDIIYDNTIESGVWYKYGVQIIETNGDRGILNQILSPVLREFEYAYLIGENGRQLRLSYNNTMNSYVYNYLESKTDTIGGQYPYITRNGNTKYRTIPINALISFNMDENELFTSDSELYTYSNVISSYVTRRKEKHLGTYDYKREFDFREKVLEFLQDGKPKLFKSATEGNLIVRLMQVAAQPQQSLNRMLYAFTSTAHEIAEATMENYLKYNFYTVGEYASSFQESTSKLGQLDIDLNVGDNLLAKIWEKYDRSFQNIAGMRLTLRELHHLTLEFTDKPLKVRNNAGEIVLGNNIIYNGKTITVRDGYSRIYIFDENIALSEGDSIILSGDIENLTETIHVTVDFLYEQISEPYIEKIISSQTVSKNIGQLYGNYSAGANLYSELYYKYYYEWEFNFRRLTSVIWTCIEALPGAVFQIQDSTDAAGEYHDINWTGILNLEDFGAISSLKYIGMRKSDGSIDTSVKCDILVDYLYYTTEGTYEEE